MFQQPGEPLVSKYGGWRSLEERENRWPRLIMVEGHDQHSQPARKHGT